VIQMIGEKHVTRMAGVNDYTTIQDVTGQAVLTYFEKTSEEAGIPIFQPKMTIVGGIPAPMPEGEDDGMNGLVARMQTASELASLEGTVQVDGKPAWVLRFTGVDELGWTAPSGGEDAFVPKVVTLHVDQAESVVVGIRFEGQAPVDGVDADVAIQINLTDFREVEGMLHPFQMSFVQEGLLGGPNGAQALEAQAQIAAARAQLSSVPEAQRAGYARMIDEQAAAIEAMFAGEPMVMLTTDLQVNTGPPGGF